MHSPDSCILLSAFLLSTPPAASASQCRSMRLKTKLTVQGEVLNGAILQQVCSSSSRRGGHSERALAEQPFGPSTSPSTAH